MTDPTGPRYDAESAGSAGGTRVEDVPEAAPGATCQVQPQHLRPHPGGRQVQGEYSVPVASPFQ